MNHIELARWPNYIIIAPASANIISQLACGSADNLITCICLATKLPIILVPAMNQVMWNNQIVQNNLNKLLQLPNYTSIGPDIGIQACGDIGPGRMLSIQSIFNYINTLS
uniref:Coenzyme A biosynthesis bifunctional protein CoaBC n=1 Tax=Lygus hesperus TaxID=30085 RepID=A0A0A9YBY8_LYGHE